MANDCTFKTISLLSALILLSIKAFQMIKMNLLLRFNFLLNHIFHCWLELWTKMSHFVSHLFLLKYMVSSCIITNIIYKYSHTTCGIWYYWNGQKSSGGRLDNILRGELENFRHLVLPPPEFFSYSDGPVWSICVSLQGFFFVCLDLNVFLGHKNPI